MALDRKQIESKWSTSTGLCSLTVKCNQPPHTSQPCLPHSACALKLCAFNLWAKLKPFFLKFLFQWFYHSIEKNNSYSHWSHGHHLIPSTTVPGETKEKLKFTFKECESNQISGTWLQGHRFCYRKRSCCKGQWRSPAIRVRKQRPKPRL